MPARLWRGVESKENWASEASLRGMSLKIFLFL